MSVLPEAVRRWVRLQKELGLDEVFLDESWAPPAQAAATAAPGRAPSAPQREPSPTGTRSALAPAPRTAPSAPPPPERRPAAPAPRAPQPVAGDRPAPFSFQPPKGAAAPPAPVAKAPAPYTAPVRPSAIPVFQDVGSLRDHMRSCTRCILHANRKGVVPSGGEDRSTWAVLTLYGWADDVEFGQLLSGTYAAAFRELVVSAGLPQPAILPLLGCSPTDPADTSIQGFTEAVKCRPHWTQALKLSGAKAVLVLDHKATQFARGPSAPVEWPAFRGEPWTLEGLPAISTHHPARLARSTQLGPEVASDLARLKILLEKTA
jgi:uracil-DNA glycosylase